MIVDLRFRNRSPIQMQHVNRTTVACPASVKTATLVLWVTQPNGDVVRHMYAMRDIADMKVWDN